MYISTDTQTSHSQYSKVKRITRAIRREDEPDMWWPVATWVASARSQYNQQ
jgi:hypothetical protein